jgi:hypothetical protein
MVSAAPFFTISFCNTCIAAMDEEGHNHCLFTVQFPPAINLFLFLAVDISAGKYPRHSYAVFYLAYGNSFHFFGVRDNSDFKGPLDFGKTINTHAPRNRTKNGYTDEYKEISAI